MKIIPGSMGAHLYYEVLTDKLMTFDDIVAQCIPTPHVAGTVRLALEELKEGGWIETVPEGGWRKSELSES